MRAKDTTRCGSSGNDDGEGFPIQADERRATRKLKWQLRNIISPAVKCVSQNCVVGSHLATVQQPPSSPLPTVSSRVLVPAFQPHALCWVKVTPFRFARARVNSSLNYV